ncbi:MAG: Gfo/Idh/MocA family oxidoreductase [Candidatus Glassbacteria bacterium]|nr:Gfo/Idh/MocA family oxidoreductase [Candidatus Glassbacteria bacterium]
MAAEKKKLGRRNFLATAAGAALAMPLARAGGLKAGPAGKKIRVALVGTGTRGINLWGKDLLERYGDILEMVGLCDINPGRLEFGKKYMGAGCQTFTDFDTMVRQTRPDRVIVTTMDCFHAKYICRAMELGCDVITEKPLATDEKMCQDILDTERRTGRKVTVTFNYRYNPEAEEIKKILASGEIGQLTSVDYNYYLDTDHGASYFRRWHGFKQFSGSLLVHKATHHFDLLNWWINAEPVEVCACGELRKYGWNSPFRGTNCRTCQHTDKCEFYWDITKDKYSMDLYVAQENYDGYLRDACLFRKKINIWDTMAAQVSYHNEVMLSYSLNAFMPYEGYRVGFNGTRGRLDARVYHNQPWKVDRLADFRVATLFGETRTFTISERGGSGHWGSDARMQDMIFRDSVPDPLGQAAGSRQGAMSILIGIAARRSIENRRPFKVEELVKI